MILIRVSHKDGTLREISINQGPFVEKILRGLHQRNPTAYGRLMHYGQCRYFSTDIAKLRVYWFTLESMDWEIIQLMVTKELESHQ